MLEFCNSANPCPSFQVVAGILFGFLGSTTARFLNTSLPLYVSHIISNMIIFLLGKTFSSRCFHRKGRDPIVLLGLLLALISYFLTFLTIPNSANMGETREEAFVNPNSVLIVFTAFLIGFSDACFITQVLMLGLDKLFPPLRSHLSWAMCTRRSRPLHSQYSGFTFVSNIISNISISSIIATSASATSAISASAT